MSADHIDDRIREALDGTQTYSPAGKAKAKGDAAGAPLIMPATYTEEELAEENIPPAEFIVEGMFTVGLTLISASPKLGKTWLKFILGRSVATGGLFCGSKRVKEGPWLQLDLEGVRNGGVPSPNLHFAHEWPPMDAGGLELLEAKIIKGGFVGVGIDVWTMFRPVRPKNADPYHHDHQSARQVADLAQRTNCGIFVTNHNRKAEALDWTAEAIGTNGLIGGCDTVCTLMRKRGEADAVMKITGRDIDEQELAMSFKGGLWTILGDAAEVLMNKTRQTIHSTLSFTGKPMRPAEIAKATDLSRELVKRTLLRMLRDGTIKADGGFYSAKTGTDR
jgi:AAA domain